MLYTGWYYSMESYMPILPNTVLHYIQNQCLVRRNNVLRFWGENDSIFGPM